MILLRMWLRENSSTALVSEAISGFEPCLQKIQASVTNREACSGQAQSGEKSLEKHHFVYLLGRGEAFRLIRSSS